MVFRLTHFFPNGPKLFLLKKKKKKKRKKEGIGSR